MPRETCRSCYFCVPYRGKTFTMFLWGTCYQAKRKVNANMTACALYQARGHKVAVKSTPEKRNTYRDKDDNVMEGFVLPEVLDVPLIIHAKREYTWGLYSGLAVKVEGQSGKLAIIEITAPTPIKALCMPDLPKTPYKAMFVERTSKNQHNYFTIKLLNGKDDGDDGEGVDNVLPF